MTNDAQRAAIKKLIAKRTKEVTASKAKAREYLIREGFYTDAGDLTTRYGGKKVRSGIVSRLHTSFVLAYHGCDKELGLRAVRGEVPLRPSKSAYDWMGNGIYFWESDPVRAMEWARQKADRGQCKEPYVIGAAIDLGNCLDLLARADVALVQEAFTSFKEMREKAGLPMPENKRAPKDPSPDLVMRYLGSGPINFLAEIANG